MQYLTQKELREMILCSYQRIEEKKEQINKINVFPVPDQDTGNNLARTLEGMKKAILEKDFQNLKELSDAVLDGALSAAQGNAGVIYTGFLTGFLPSLDKNPVGVKSLASAFEKGAAKARQSIMNPKEGTILDVIDQAAAAFKEGAAKEADIVGLFKEAIKKAKDALLATREKMEIFRRANVVDAGGLGFLIILESYLEALEKPTLAKDAEGREEKASEKIGKFVQLLSHRYEMVALLENPRLAEEALKARLKKLGDSADIVQVGNKMKIHIHTDYPDEVRDIIRKSGQILSLRTEDMAREVAGEESVRKVSVGLVTDDITALSPKIIEKYQIEIANAILDWPDIENIPGENIYQKMREVEKRGLKTFPKTSQATPKSYLEAYKKQLGRFENVLCLTPTVKLSGCYNSAVQARTMTETPERIFVLDSQTAAAGQALLVLRALELIQEQREVSEVIAELKNLIPLTHTYIVFEDPKWIESIGRISKSQANWVRRMKKIGLHPLMAFKDGAIQKGGMVLARNTAQAIFKKIAKESKKARTQGKKIRVVIDQADNPTGAEELKTMLKEIGAEVSFISEVPALVGAATGPGTLLVGWQPL